MTYLNEEQIESEAMYDGFYAVCTNLEDDAATIIKINKRRWEIEECFEIMKSEFKARPVYLSRKDRITAHFMTCFTALIIYRNITTFFSKTKTPQTAYLCWLWSFYLFSTVKNEIIVIAYFFYFTSPKVMNFYLILTVAACPFFLSSF